MGCTYPGTRPAFLQKRFQTFSNPKRYSICSGLCPLKWVWGNFRSLNYNKLNLKVLIKKTTTFAWKDFMWVFCERKYNNYSLLKLSLEIPIPVPVKRIIWILWTNNCDKLTGILSPFCIKHLFYFPRWKELLTLVLSRKIRQVPHKHILRAIYF